MEDKRRGKLFLTWAVLDARILDLAAHIRPRDGRPLLN